jgi:hypothetical protein
MRNGTNAVGVDSKGPFVIKNGYKYEIATTGTATAVN